MLNNNNFYTRLITSDDVRKRIRQTRSKAPGHSKINKTVLEKCPDNAIEMLTNIYNASFTAGHFPNIFKKAVIKFIPKENKSTKNPINYRPISLLEVPGKLFEKIIQGRLNSFLIENNVLKDRQHSFRPQKGTTTAIATTYETISNALSNKQQITLILRDVTKAFDKVWHEGM